MYGPSYYQSENPVVADKCTSKVCEGQTRYFDLSPALRKYCRTCGQLKVEGK